MYKQVYPSETQDLSPVMAAMAAKKPDIIVGGTQNEDAYAQVKALVQLKYSPKMMFQSNGANSPARVPGQGRRGQHRGHLLVGRLVPRVDGAGSAAFTAAYIKKYGGTAQQIDDSSAEAYACGQLLEAVAAKTGKIDNATIISSLHSGHLADAARQPLLVGQRLADRRSSISCSGRAASCCPSTRQRSRRRAPRSLKPNWGG